MLVSFPCSQNYVQYIFQKPSFYFQLTFFSFPVLDFSLFLVNSNSLGREVTGEIIYLMWEHPSSSQAGKIGSAAHLEFPSQPVYTTTTLFILTEITGWMGLIMLKSTEVVIVFNIFPLNKDLVVQNRAKWPMKEDIFISCFFVRCFLF